MVMLRHLAAMKDVPGISASGDRHPGSSLMRSVHAWIAGCDAARS
jgi:hypothetical protein